jgi:nucleoside-diphosphate-sugar epimerase
MATCLITGSTGFIGTAATRQFAAAGWSVHTLNRRPIPPAGATGVVQHAYDGTFSDVVTAFRECQPDVVIHLATHYVAAHAPHDLEPLVHANIELGIQVLEAMHAAHCSRMVTAGTAWQHYGVQDGSYRAANLYAATKQAFEDIARWYCDARKVAVTSLHLGDTFGPNDSRPKIFAALEAASRTGEPLELTAGEQQLDPLFVEDAVNAIEVAVQRSPEGFEFFNVAPGTPIRLRELVELWCDIFNARPDLRWGARPYREREVMTPWRGGERLPGWRARVSVAEGLRRCFGARS